jgi:hypothetical protein
MIWFISFGGAYCLQKFLYALDHDWCEIIKKIGRITKVYLQNSTESLNKLTFVSKQTLV